MQGRVRAASLRLLFLLLVGRFPGRGIPPSQLGPALPQHMKEQHRSQRHVKDQGDLQEQMIVEDDIPGVGHEDTVGALASHEREGDPQQPHCKGAHRKQHMEVRRM